MKALRGFAVIAGATIALGATQFFAEAQEGFGFQPSQTAEAPPAVSTNTAQVVRLSEAGVAEEIIIEYVEQSLAPFYLSTDDIIYLNDIGVGEKVIAAMLHRDTELRDRYWAAVAESTNQPALDEDLRAALANQPAVSAPPVYVTNAPAEVAYFYDTLQPYGAWIDLEGLGWCWQPTVVVIDHSWHPYWHGGRWIYTDFGWYWQSDYTWGWCAFHYGRWHHHPRHGWVWFPDRVWSPAWVCWRYSNTHCGWAPLPRGAHFVPGHGFHFNNTAVSMNFNFGLGPEAFTFVEVGRLHERRLDMHAVPATRVKEVYNQTIVVNNYGVGRNNLVINHGVPVERVTAASHVPIRTVTVREGLKPAEPLRNSERVQSVGSANVIYRPQLKAPSKPLPVTAQKVDERHPVVRPTVPQAPGSRPPIATRPPTTKPPPARSSAPAFTPVPSQRAVPRSAPTPPSKVQSPKAQEQAPSHWKPAQPFSPAAPARPPATPPPQRPPQSKPHSFDDRHH